MTAHHPEPFILKSVCESFNLADIADLEKGV